LAVVDGVDGAGVNGVGVNGVGVAGGAEAAVLTPPAVPAAPVGPDALPGVIGVGAGPEDAGTAMVPSWELAAGCCAVFAFPNGPVGCVVFPFPKGPPDWVVIALVGGG